MNHKSVFAIEMDLFNQAGSDLDFNIKVLFYLQIWLTERKSVTLGSLYLWRLTVWFLAVRAPPCGGSGSRSGWRRSRATPPSAPSGPRCQHSLALEQTLQLLYSYKQGREGERESFIWKAFDILINSFFLLTPSPPLSTLTKWTLIQKIWSSKLYLHKTQGPP